MDKAYSLDIHDSLINQHLSIWIVSGMDCWVSYIRTLSQQKQIPSIALDQSKVVSTGGSVCSRDLEFFSSRLVHRL